MPFELRYHPAVKAVDLALLDGKFTIRIKTATETRLATAPQQYGEPLRRTLQGYWKFRVGDYRIVCRIAVDTVLILAIIHRKQVYDAVVKHVENT